MKILFAGNKERGISCLNAIIDKYGVVGIIANPPSSESTQKNSFAEFSKTQGLPLFQPENANDPKFLGSIKKVNPELIVLAGYGQIVKKDFISLAKFGCINLHAGKLPEYRGSSPMNWALINGEKEFTISIIQIDEGVDTGDILIEKSFQISINDTIKELHEKANEAFPELLTSVIEKIKQGTLNPKKQNKSKSSYYPLRFPDDGLILWDVYTAEEIHNRIRALTDPYPGAFTFFKGHKLKLLKSELTLRPFYGEPGRIYRKLKDKILICAKDQCLWIYKVIDARTEKDAYDTMNRYDELATIKNYVKNAYEKNTTT
jgi:methionyl-tRNA formyltransferase